MSDNWTAISGYAVADYTDTMVFEVDYDSKKLQKISGQTLVAGEENSQYIRFTMSRYWDGIDISDKTIKVVYQLTDQYFGKSDVINGEMTEDAVRFGWVVPKTACCITGNLLFVIVVSGEEYTLKTQITEAPVVKSLDPEHDIPEPSREAWYIEFQARVDTVLNDAEDTLTDVHRLADEAAASARSAAVIKGAVDETKTDLDKVLDDLQEALEQVGVNKVNIATVVARLNQMVADYDASAEQELLDARVGHDGATYGSVGEAIRGQFDALKSTLTSLLYINTDGAINGYMVNSADGSVSANTNFSYIEFAVLGGDTIAYSTQRAETAVGIAFYDKYGLYSAGYPAVAGEQILVVPDNAVTAKAAYRTAHAGAFYVKFLKTLMRLVDNASEETSIPQNIGDITTESYDVAARITQGVRLTGYNTTTFLPITRADSAYFMAEMVLPQNMEEVIIPTPTSTPDYNFLIAYTENDKALNTKYAQLVSGTSAMRDYVSIETDGVHIKVKKLISAGYANLAIEGLTTDFGSFAINGSGVSLDWASVPLPETGQVKQYTGLSMFETIHCLGDSYTQGGIKSSDGANWLRAKKPYPQVIADNLGIDVTNFGVGGASVKSYLTNGLSAVLETNAPDLYILCFGINDAGNSDTVGTVADINDSDYTLNADSFCGNYGRIIAQLKAHAPLARYVIFGQWHWDTSAIAYSQYTAAAKAVAEHYSIPFVDPFDDSFFGTSLYRSTMVSGHPTQVTYTGMAYAVMRLMAECIADNDTYYRYAGLEAI